MKNLTDIKTAPIGTYAIMRNGCEYAVMRKCPMNTSNPQPDHAFWRQVSKNYKTRGWAEKAARKAAGPDAWIY